MTSGRPAVLRAGAASLSWLLPAWYLVTRLAVVGLLSGPVAAEQRRVGGLSDVTYRDFVTVWDGQWYARIAAQGYPLPLPLDAFGRVDQSEWAFYPLFPLLVRLVTQVGPPFWVAAQVVNLFAGAAAAWLAYRLLSGEQAGFRPTGTPAGRVAAHRRTAAVAVGLWLLYPATTVLQIAYSEAVALLLVMAVLTAMHRRRYGIALVLVLALGFARAVAAPLAFVVFAHLIVRARREWAPARVFPPGDPDGTKWLASPATGSPGSTGSTGSTGSHVVVGAGRRRVEIPSWWFSGLAVLGGTVVAGVAWPVLVGWLTGRPDAFFAVQATWGQRPDRGPFQPWWTWLVSNHGLPAALGAATALALLCGCMLTRYAAWMPLELRAWGLAYPLYLFAVTAPSTSMIRFLLLNLPVFGVVAALLVGDPRRGRSRRCWAVGPLLCLPILAWTVHWWATVLLVFTPPMDWPP